MLPDLRAEPIVLIEDSSADVFFVRHALQKARIVNPLLVFGSATEARRHLDASGPEEHPVLFILDVQLDNNESGIDFLRWLRAQPAPLADAPAMIVSASDDPADRKDSDLLGAAHFLRKPVTEEALTHAVQALGFVLVVTSLTDVAAGRLIQRR